MEATIVTKEDFIAAASKGLPRVAEAIIGTPAKARMGVINAVVESYREAVRDFLEEGEAEKWLVDVVARLETEVSVQEKLQTGAHVETVSLVPAAEPEHETLDTVGLRS
jgi:hypothetical protein